MRRAPCVARALWKVYHRRRAPATAPARLITTNFARPRRCICFVTSRPATVTALCAWEAMIQGPERVIEAPAIAQTM